MEGVKLSTRGKWGVAWMSWAGYFALLETKALRSKHPDAPLSGHLRWVLGIKKKSWHKHAGRAVYCGGVMWLARHLYHIEQDR